VAPEVTSGSGAIESTQPLDPRPVAKAKRGEGTLPPSVPSNVPSAAELGLLDEALVALQSDPARALALTAEHRVRFRAGALVQEREVIAIEALVRLHRTAAARARIDDFLRSFPSSAHRVRINALAQRLAQGSDER
jgi:hypothetical protein